MRGIPDELFGISVKDLARLCQVTEKTARRYKAGTVCPPPAVIILLRLLKERELGAIHPNWKDWKISERGELCSPENWIATPGEIRAIQLQEAQLQAQRQEIGVLRYKLAELERTCPWLDEQPTPDQWDALKILSA